MSLKLTVGDGAGHPVSEMILGHNIEMCLTTADGLLSERLRNPKFLGPPHPVTGVAPHWQGASCGLAAYELTPGAGLMGAEAQLVRAIVSNGTHHLHQNQIAVLADEELECEIWARAWHEPVTLQVSLLPLSSHTAAYARGEIVVDTPYFKRFTLPLKATRDDHEARLSIQIVGVGELWFDQIHLRPKAEPLLCKGVMEAMASMRIPTLRFPGGIVVNAYNWRHGTGPVHLRRFGYDPAFHQDWHLNYDFGLDEVLRLCADQGIAPTLTVNVATGTPQEAAEMAAYCAAWFVRAGGEPPLIYWHIANHPYARTTAHMTPAMYAGVLKAYVPALRAGYPRSRIVAVMSSGELDAEPERAAWREALFTEAAELIDVVAVQIYGGCDPTASAADQVQALGSALAGVEPGLRAFIKRCRDRNSRWNVGIAEWNWWMQASHWDGRAFEEPPTALHGLYIAGMIHRFAALAPDFEVACFYNLVNCMGILNHRGATVEVTDAVEIFKLYRPALPGRFVALDRSGGVKGDAAEVEALALENDDGRWIFLTNRSASEAARVSLEGLSPAGAKVEGFVASSPTGTFDRFESRPAGSTLDLPPLSILRVRCGRK